MNIGYSENKSHQYLWLGTSLNYAKKHASKYKYFTHQNL